MKVWWDASSLRDICHPIQEEPDWLVMTTTTTTTTTRMVQLPATAAIEYVAACWVPGAGGFLSGELMPVPPKFNAYTNRLGFLCLAS